MLHILCVAGLQTHDRTHKSDSLKMTLSIKLTISVAAIVLILARMRWPQLQIDSITLGLVILAIIPWLVEVISSAEFMGWKVELRKMETRQGKQEDELNALKFIVAHLVTRQELAHLKNLKTVSMPFRWVRTGDFENELRHLRDLGLLQTKHGKTIADMLRDEGSDAHAHIEITQSGMTYLKLRRNFYKPMKGESSKC